MFEHIYGIKIFVDDAACVRNIYKQVRFPRSKKVRIRKKWKKNRNNYAVEVKHLIFKTPSGIVMSSKHYKSLREHAIAGKASNFVEELRGGE